MVIKVDASKMMEILFENSEEYPNYVYIHLMYLLKEYNDNKENQEEINQLNVENIKINVQFVNIKNKNIL